MLISEANLNIKNQPIKSHNIFYLFRILESDMKKSAVYKIFSTALSRLIIVKGNPIKMCKFSNFYCIPCYG